MAEPTKAELQKQVDDLKTELEQLKTQPAATQEAGDLKALQAALDAEYQKSNDLLNKLASANARITELEKPRCSNTAPLQEPREHPHLRHIMASLAGALLASAAYRDALTDDTARNRLVARCHTLAAAIVNHQPADQACNTGSN